MTADTLTLYDDTFSSRFLLGTALYPSPTILNEAIIAAQTEIITVSLRRQSPDTNSGNNFWSLLKQQNLHFLPNTAGCKTSQEAITLAHMAREIFNTNWIKLEVIGDEYTLQPDPFELVNAAKILIKEGFKVFPYCTDDLILCQKLVQAGCQVLMPWASPIGSGLGLLNTHSLSSIRNRFPDISIIIDAGIGAPSHACTAMEMGFDGVLLNTAVADSRHPPLMAEAFRDSVKAGRNAYLAGIIDKRALAKPSTSTVGIPFWHQKETHNDRK